MYRHKRSLLRLAREAHVLGVDRVAQMREHRAHMDAFQGNINDILERTLGVITPREPEPRKESLS